MVHCSTKSHKGIEIEKFVIHRSLKKYLSLPQEATWGDQVMVPAERVTRLGAMSLLRSVGEVF